MLTVDCIVNSVYNSCTYVLSKDKEAILVDCGDVEPIYFYLQEKGLSLKAVFITHTHFDHIYGLNELIKKFPDITVYTSEKGKEGLYNPKFNMSRYHTEATPFVYKGHNVEVLEHEQEIKIGGILIKAYFTPGHDWSCLTYHIGSFLFTGDSYIPGINTVTTFPKSNKQQAKDSLDRLLELEQKGLFIFGGHEI